MSKQSQTNLMRKQMGTSSNQEHQMGSMDISAHRAAYAGFMKVTVWSCIAIAITLALMAKFLVD